MIPLLVDMGEVTQFLPHQHLLGKRHWKLWVTEQTSRCSHLRLLMKQTTEQLRQASKSKCGRVIAEPKELVSIKIRKVDR
jgi:hypothetical protein